MPPGDIPHYIGPHEGRELELMMESAKPLSMFVEAVPRSFESFPEAEFDSLVAEGKLKKLVSLEWVRDSNGMDHNIRRVLYSLPEEEWRMNAILLVQNLYNTLTPGWRPDLDRVIGLLLGYAREDIEKFVQAKKI